MQSFNASNEKLNTFFDFNCYIITYDYSDDYLIYRYHRMK